MLSKGERSERWNASIEATSNRGRLAAQILGSANPLPRRPRQAVLTFAAIGQSLAANPRGASSKEAEIPPARRFGRCGNPMNLIRIVPAEGRERASESGLPLFPFLAVVSSRIARVLGDWSF